MSFLFDLQCLECEGELESAATMDDDMDILMVIKPCKACLETAKMAGLKSGEKIYKNKDEGEKV